ncbi:MAG: 3-phosphoserine/phosphohydroxythreonine transaminase [Clostridiales Family XIII bacterium]|jgi:phosphoserine aminotransferase|nr:3-phosphoserine/phosphohydroxythreonine transaminase [Clostridiales Family XIII bacterium]
MSKRVYNFSAGPSMLPPPVLEQAAREMMNFNETGMSILEISHRSKAFDAVILAAEENLRTLMHIPEHYKVLFLQGGATLQFSMVPANLLTGTRKADYILTGVWAKKAAEEAKKYGDIRIAATSEDANFSYIPKTRPADFRADADYVHITLNNTIFGTRYAEIPDTGNIPLVADFSSGILSEEIDVSKFALIYAGAQKNVAPAGLTIVIVREDFLGKAPSETPIYFNYKTHADNGSMYNTPPTWCIYIAGEVFKYLLAHGGVAGAEENNKAKAGLLYDFIDASAFYYAPAKPDSRSLMNVVFRIGDEQLEKKFVAEAKENELIDLNGHRLAGGMRASIYNAMPMEGIEALITFMKKYEEENQ